MVRSGQEFYQVLNLPRGLHAIKFIVDDGWRCSVDLPTIQDGITVNNVLDTTNYEAYDPAPISDPLNTEVVFHQTISEAPSTEPPTVPVLLLKSNAVAVPVAKDLASNSFILEPHLCTEKTKPLIPAHATCMHVFSDSSSTFTNAFGSMAEIWIANVRYRSKIACHVFLKQQLGLGNNALKSLFTHNGARAALDQGGMMINTSVSRDLTTFTD